MARGNNSNAEKTLGEVVGQFTADISKDIVAGVIAQGTTFLAIRTVSSFFATPPTATVLGFFAITAFGIGLLTTYVDDQYKFTELMKKVIEKLIDEI